MVMPIERAPLQRTVQDVPKVTNPDEVPPSFGGGDAISEISLFAIAQFADEFAPWGYFTRLRDVQLREFSPSEPIWASAVATVAARNAAFSWRLDGGARLVQHAQDVLQYASFGAGWRSFVTRFTYDLLGQDNGAFVEVIRTRDRPDAQVIGVANLDAGRCWRTGDPRNPVLYSDLKGKRHLMPWWRVIPFAEMPSNIERLRGIQYSAETRVLRAAQLFRDIEQFHAEKLGGRRPESLHVLHNVSASALTDALSRAKMQANNQQLYRYMEPIIVETLNKTEAPSLVTVPLRGLPDSFDGTAFYNQYVDQVAMALLSDRQDFVPLQGGNLGTSTQSEVLARKTRGKGPGLFMKLLEDAFNFYNVLGNGVRFEFDEQDLAEDQDQATVDKTRAEGRKIYVDSGILTAQVIRQQMADDGELDEAYLELMGDEDATDEETGNDTSPIDAQAEVEVTAQAEAPATLEVVAAPAPNPLANIRAASAAVVRKDPTHAAMDDTEEAATTRFADALDSARGSFARAVRKAVPAEAKVVTQVRQVTEEAQRAIVEQGKAVEVALKATVEDLAEVVTASSVKSSEDTARAVAENTQLQLAGIAALQGEIREMARPKRRVIVRDERGLVVETIEETIDG